MLLNFHQHVPLSMFVYVPVVMAACSHFVCKLLVWVCVFVGVGVCLWDLLVFWVSDLRVKACLHCTNKRNTRNSIAAVLTYRICNPRVHPFIPIWGCGFSTRKVFQTSSSSDTSSSSSGGVLRPSWIRLDVFSPASSGSVSGSAPRRSTPRSGYRSDRNFQLFVEVSQLWLVRFLSVRPPLLGPVCLAGLSQELFPRHHSSMQSCLNREARGAVRVRVALVHVPVWKHWRDSQWVNFQNKSQGLSSTGWLCWTNKK